MKLLRFERKKNNDAALKDKKWNSTDEKTIS